MRTTFLVAALGVALTACGGGGGGGGSFRDPDTIPFDLGAEQTPTAAEATAAGEAASAAIGMTALAGEAGTSSAPDGSYGGATSPLATASTLPGGAVFASTNELDDVQIAQVATILLPRRPAVDWTAGCWTATGAQVTFDACPLPIDAPGWTLPGSLTLSGPFDVGAGLVTWDAAVEAHLGEVGALDAFTVNGLEHLTGGVAWTDTTLSGHSRVDVGLSLFFYGRGDPGSGRMGWHEWHDLWRGVTYDLEYDLTHAPAAVCASRVTGGTLTVKRVWGVLPAFAKGDAYTDAAVRFTWSGCGDVTVARSWGAI